MLLFINKGVHAVENIYTDLNTSYVIVYRTHNPY